jgi:hypothetical protein
LTQWFKHYKLGSSLFSQCRCMRWQTNTARVIFLRLSTRQNCYKTTFFWFLGAMASVRERSTLNVLSDWVAMTVGGDKQLGVTSKWKE